MKTKTREHPLLLSGDMVRAVLSGAKTQTRRPIKPQPAAHQWIGIDNSEPAQWWKWEGDRDESAEPLCSLRCPYGQPGDRLWVRETFDAIEDPGALRGDVKRKVWNEAESETEYWVVDYRADGEHHRIIDKIGRRKWTPSIHMPRWASRLTLEITDIRVQRVQEISEEDAQKEGCKRPILSEGPVFEVGGMKLKTHPMTGYYRDAFMDLWDSLYGKGAWEANPLVWALTFRRAEALGE